MLSPAWSDSWNRNPMAGKARTPVFGEALLSRFASRAGPSAGVRSPEIGQGRAGRRLNGKLLGQPLGVDVAVQYGSHQAEKAAPRRLSRYRPIDGASLLGGVAHDRDEVLFGFTLLR